MTKGNIILIEPTSTGVNYIYDVRKLGYNPISLELYQDEESRSQQRYLHDLHYSLNGDDFPEILQADISYEKTLEMVKELNPVLIMPGSDEGIIWATKMANDLGLPGNSPDIIKNMISKQYMQKSLKSSNLRYIRSEFISSFEDAKNFKNKHNLSKVIIKPSIGQATIGVCICETDDELKEALKLNEELCSSNDFDGILIQEFIGGEEYIIDSVSCEDLIRSIAFHYVNKIRFNGGPVVDYEEELDDTHPYFSILNNYHKEVVKSIGVEYGLVHAEYKIDENGPVLIEVNCRAHGGLRKYYILDKVYGNHQTDLSIDSYLNPIKFREEYVDSVKLNYYFIQKYIIVNRDIYVEKSNINEVFSDLDSFEYAMSFGDDRVYHKTKDLATSGGFVCLVNTDKDKLMEDLEAIKKMEKDNLDKIFDIKEGF